MKGYLLDTNALSDWFLDTGPRHQAVLQRIASLPQDTPLMTSAVVIGEIIYGLAVAPPSKASTLSGLPDEIRRQLPRPLLIDESTAAVYGDLRARLFEKYAPRENRRKGLRPEQLVDPETSEKLGIQENDLWIAAQAIERNLVLASNDKMLRIRDVAADLSIEDWGQSST